MTTLMKPGDTVKGRLGTYRILGQIGKGAQGTVYKAEIDGKLVAIKIFDGNGEEGSARANWLHSRKLRDDTPAVLPSDMVEAPDRKGSGYAMAFMEAPSLADFIEGREAAASFADEMKFCTDIAAGVALLHAQGIAHGDLRPDNILRLPENRACFLDMDNYAADGQPYPPNMLGDIFWYAPELRKSRDACHVSTASDVYSLALILHQVLLRRHDHGHCDDLDDLEAAAASGWNNDPFSGAGRDDGYPVAMLDTQLAALMRASLSPDPKLRPAAYAWRDALMGILEEGRLFYCPHCCQPIFLDLGHDCPHCRQHLGDPVLHLGPDVHFPVRKGGLRLGRGELASTRVSGRHIHVQRMGPFLRVTDLDSTNGTRYTDSAGHWRFLAPGHTALLAPGSRLRCADVELEVGIELALAE